MSSSAEEPWEIEPPPEPGTYVRAPLRADARAANMGLARGVQPPMTEDEYRKAMEHASLPQFGGRERIDPHRCIFNEAPRHSGVTFQCRTVISDPRELRYCMEHAREVGYPLTPEQLERFTDEEARIRLKGLSSKAVAQLAKVMEDEDAPAGVRAKAATDILDRTGFHAKAGLDVQVEAVVIDMGQVVRDRLEAKRKQLEGLTVIEQVDDDEPA